MFRHDPDSLMDTVTSFATSRISSADSDYYL